MHLGLFDAPALLDMMTAKQAVPRPVVEIAGLPEDVFLLILEYLQIWDVSCCQLVSRSWREAFSKLDHLQRVLKRYSSARECPRLSHYLSDSRSEAAWRAAFQQIASRYYHISHGKACHVQRHKLAPSEQIGHFHPVGQWDYHESQPGGRLYYENAATHLSRLNAKPYLFRATLWSYSDGLVVCAPEEPVSGTEVGEVLALLDLHTGKTFRIPFNIASKIIRNVRLHRRTLIIEWAERDPFHNLNDMEQVNRHFASCLDIVSHHGSCDSVSIEWSVQHRSEFKLHFLGLPLNSRDRFFSTHNENYYAVYFYRPNRSMYTGDEDRPIESLVIWDISHPSEYLPSLDPSGHHRPRSHDEGPTIAARFSFNELERLGIRQHSQIRLMSLAIDAATATFTWRENVCVAGQGYFDPAERLWCAKTTSFPFMAEGPELQREWDGYLPPYRGHGSMESSDIDEVGMEKWFVPIMDTVDEGTGVRLSLVETCFTGLSMMENKLVIRIKIPWLDEQYEDGAYVPMKDDDLVQELSVMGRIAGDERWVVGQNERQELVVARF